MGFVPVAMMVTGAIFGMEANSWIQAVACLSLTWSGVVFFIVLAVAAHKEGRKVDGVG